MGLFHKTVVFLNSLIFLTSFGFFVFACVTISQFDRSNNNLFSRGDFGWLVFGGMLGMGVGVLGCLGARDPLRHYNLLFCYFFWLSTLIGILSIGFYLYRVFVLDLEGASGDVEDAIRLEAAKEFNDFLISIYVFCCSGCSILGECVEDIDAFANADDEVNCPTVGAPGDVGVDCIIPPICDAAQLEIDEGLGQGCTINSPVIPSYDIGDNFCIFFNTFARNGDGIDIVNLASEGSCGGGDAAVFVEDVFEFMRKNYYVIVSFWAIGLMIMGIAWFGALFILLCPDRYDPDRK